MLSFATEFPVNEAVTCTGFADAIRKWLLGSRYTSFSLNSLSGLCTGEFWKANEAMEKIESHCEITTDSESIGVVYRKADTDFEWITTIVLAIVPSSTWISLRVECEPMHPTAKVPVAKKPVLLRTLLESLGGGIDGDFKVGGTPVVFAKSELDLAVRCVLGETCTYLPIIYISATFHGYYLVDPYLLAESLAGLAHVVVEPNREFSVSLMEKVDRKNPYGGTIALYWPDGGGKRNFFSRGAVPPAEIQQSIFDEVRLSLSNRRPLVRCTLAAIKELKSRRMINSLKDEGSKEIQSYVSLYEEELNSKMAALQAAETEILRLKAEARRFAAHEMEGVGMALNTGGEQDFYEGELLDTVRDALQSGINNVVSDGRRQHILEDLVAANPVSEERLRNRERIKSLLRDYQRMDTKTRKKLEEIGFAITEEGKHFKIIYQNDSRYTFALPKSGGDYRGGLNSAGDICRLLF